MSKQSLLLQAALLCRVVQEGMPSRRLQVALAVKEPDQSPLTGSGEIRKEGLHCQGVQHKVAHGSEIARCMRVGFVTASYSVTLLLHYTAQVSSCKMSPT